MGILKNQSHETETKKIVKVIIGSTRSERAGRSVAEWVIEQADKFLGAIKFELLDLKEINLPFLDEPGSPRSDPYIHSHTKEWSKIIKDSDAFVIVCPEYNYGYSGVLKNAIDFLYWEWVDKPVSFVGYGGGGATDSIRQLKEVLISIKMKIQTEQIGINKVWEAIDSSGKLQDKYIDGDIQLLFKELEETLLGT